MSFPKRVFLSAGQVIVIGFLFLSLEKFVNLITMQLSSKENECEMSPFFLRKKNLPVMIYDLAEMALEFDFLSSILSSEVKQIESLLGFLLNEIQNSRVMISLFQHDGEAILGLEGRLHDPEQSLRQLIDQVVMFIPVAVVCCGLSILIRLTNGRGKMTCQLLRQAIPVNDLKGLGECLENEEIENPIVVVRGTVGSNSTVDKSSLGVFIEETAKLDIEITDASGKISKTNFRRREEVPWYLDDGTARVYVCDYRLAEGFYDTLKQYYSREPFITYFKTFASDHGKEVLMLTDDVDCRKRQQVLEIGTYLTVVGTAVRDKDGAPTIAAYRFFKGHFELDDFVNDLELALEDNGNLSLHLIALSAVLVALHMLHTRCR